MGKQLELFWEGHWAFPVNYKKPKFNSQKPLKTKKMYKVPYYPESSIVVDDKLEGETLESKIAKMVKNKEPINAEGVNMIYTERKKGVLAETNVRTDRWEIATDAMGIVEKTHKAKRDNHLRIEEGGKSEGQANSQMAENGGQ